MKKTIVHKSRKALAKLLKGQGVEVGVAAGEFSRVILDANPDTELIGVDPYMAYPEYGDYALPETFKNLRAGMINLVGHEERFSHLQAMSGPASDLFQDNSLDFVYIDGNHSFTFVQQDMNAWYRKIKSGGIMAGDDYAPRTSSRYDVVAAVDDWCEKYEMDLTIYTNGENPGQWIVRKP